ncbi:MAG: FIST C-terminal domain-containing protein, partial [Pseudomonadota bacterium]
MIEAAHRTGADQTLLLFAGQNSLPEVAPLLATLRDLGVACLGAVFPEVLSGRRRSRSGFVTASLDSCARPVLLQDGDLSELTSVHSTVLSDRRHGDVTLMALADADHLDVARTMKRLHRQFGNRCRYLGGGGGTYGETPTPCVFTAEHGCRAGALALGFIRGASAVHAGHGWQRAIGPVVATRTVNSVIAELNWRPAYDVYRQLIRQTTGDTIERMSFSDVGLKYPLGMIKEDSEDLVRVPLRVTEAGGLVVIGDVPAHSVLHIMSGRPDDLISAAAR